MKERELIELAEEKLGRPIRKAIVGYRGNAEPYYYNIAQNFWNLIQGRYRYATGGVGNGEMFRQPYTQILSMATNVTSDGERNLHPSPTLNETCCAYNLAKLTKDLNCFNPFIYHNNLVNKNKLYFL